MEHFAQASASGVGVRVISDHRQGFAWAGSLVPDVVAETLDEARDNARLSTADEFAGLAEPDGVEAVKLDLYKPGLAGVETDDKIALVLELERATKEGDQRIDVVESADYADSIAIGAAATSTGIRSSSSETGCYVSTYAIAKDDEDTETGFGFSVGRDFDELDSHKAASDAIDRSTRLLGAVKPASARTTVVLDPYVTAQFLGIIASTFSGESVLKGRSLFANRLGERCVADCVTLVDDPTNPDAYGARETDGEGLATRPNTLIESGVVKGFLHNAYTARRAGNHFHRVGRTRLLLNARSWSDGGCTSARSSHTAGDD